MDADPQQLSLDTNIMFYAFDGADARKHAVAERIVDFCQEEHVRLPLQVLSEFYQVASGKLLEPSEAAAVVAEMRNNLEIVPASEEDLAEAIELQQQAKLQFYDALLLCTASRAGVHVLLSEDMQHGRVYAGVRVLNPFVMDEVSLSELLAG